ncbi:molybdate transporter [Vibrio caribbeanicus]|uniref:Molybdate transporter n=1 Tax=Vibrio caribbeanicus TaxID=701175 RepID=A0ACC4NYC1_9VIBR|nr:molybdate ABC transporter substrate-binding protein [Vibrio caribbeanicus]KHD25630.1 molybdate transporter [Vibrio caribbeanicus]
MNFIPTITVAILAIFSISANAADKLRVYAASSMTSALTQIAEQFEKNNDIDVTLIFGGSSSLARQLVNGAPGDVFISANDKWMDYVVKINSLNSDAVTSIASNRLVVIAPKGSSTHLEVGDTQSWRNALGNSRLAIGQTNAVPAGIYAKQALENLGQWEFLKGHLAPTSNVRIALTLVERQEAPLGIVYHTDALASDGVTSIATLDSSLHSPISYPAIELRSTPQSTEFLRYLKSEDAKAILHKHGFQ